MCSFFSDSTATSVTLFHTCRVDSSDTCHALTDMWEKPDNSVTGKLTVGARRSITKAKQLFEHSSLEIEQMITKTVEEKYGKVKDILTEGNHGHYDAIVLGRRATYALQWLFARPTDELPQAMIKDNNLQTPIWVCCEHDPGRKNVLACVDGSENSFRVVDHVGYVLSRTPNHGVTIFHVNTGTDTNEKEIFTKAEEILLENGMSREKIDFVSNWGISIANTIINKADSGKYAAIAIGLHGEGKNLLSNFSIMGGNTSTLINKAEKFAIWCCP